METASFLGVIKAIFYLIIFYYIFKFAMRLILPILLNKAVQKAEENLRRHEQGNSADSQTIHRNPKDLKPNDNKKVGEYVDFEEIE